MLDFYEKVMVISSYSNTYYMQEDRFIEPSRMIQIKVRKF